MTQNIGRRRALGRLPKFWMNYVTQLWKDKLFLLSQGGRGDRDGPEAQQRLSKLTDSPWNPRETHCRRTNVNPALESDVASSSSVWIKAPLFAFREGGWSGEIVHTCVKEPGFISWPRVLFLHLFRCLTGGCSDSRTVRQTTSHLGCFWEQEKVLDWRRRRWRPSRVPVDVTFCLPD